MPVKCRKNATRCRRQAVLTITPNEWLLLAERWELMAAQAELLAAWELPRDRQVKDATVELAVWTDFDQDECGRRVRRERRSFSRSSRSVGLYA